MQIKPTSIQSLQQLQQLQLIGSSSCNVHSYLVRTDEWIIVNEIMTLCTSKSRIRILFILWKNSQGRILAFKSFTLLKQSNLPRIERH